MDSNQDLQASHEILKLFEIAKSHSDQILDHSAGIYAVINASGEIHRGNIQLAKLLNVHFETLHLHDLQELMSLEQWDEFKNQISQVSQAQSQSVSFEMEVTGNNQQSKSFLFHLRSVCVDKKNNQLVYTLLGQDVTELKRGAIELGRMQAELSTAKEVQDSLFVEELGEYESYKILGSHSSASECGGDWWYHTRIGHKVFIWIGDVTGHGVAAALVTAAARAAVSLIEQDLNLTPAKALVHLNRAVFSVSHNKKLMTFFVASIDLNSGECCYANAGHPLPVFFSSNNNSKASVPTLRFLPALPSSVLGLREQASFVENSIQFQPGDFFFAFTDGVTEARNSQNVTFGDRRLLQAILEAGTEAGMAVQNINQIYNHFKNSLDVFQGSGPLQDDQTFFIFQRT